MPGESGPTTHPVHSTLRLTTAVLHEATACCMQAIKHPAAATAVLPYFYMHTTTKNATIHMLNHAWPLSLQQRACYYGTLTTPGDAQLSLLAFPNTAHSCNQVGKGCRIVRANQPVFTV
jgi:hypothetical protein